MSQPHIDQKYIIALAENNTLLVSELYERYSGKIKGMVLKNNGSEDDAADIFQEALISIYQKATAPGGFTLTCPLDAYLYLICKNRWINELEKRKNKGVTFTDTERYTISEDVHQSAETLRNHSARRQLMEEKFAELGEGCRQLLQLSWSGKAMDEVAKLLDMTYAYARKKKSECMGKLTSLVKTSPRFATLQW
jgi:RNA polymerase sigma factor (sigma-70 family)